MKLKKILTILQEYASIKKFSQDSILLISLILLSVQFRHFQNVNCELSFYWNLLYLLWPDSDIRIVDLDWLLTRLVGRYHFYIYQRIYCIMDIRTTTLLRLVVNIWLDSLIVVNLMLVCSPEYKGDSTRKGRVQSQQVRLGYCKCMTRTTRKKFFVILGKTDSYQFTCLCTAMERRNGKFG